MSNSYYLGDVFIVIEVAGADDSITNYNVVKVFSNQYAADQCAWDFNQRAKKANIRQRYAVIYRDLYE